MKKTIDINKAVLELSRYEITELDIEESSLPYLNQLNKRQKIAATRGEGNYLVIAGPGTGKTHTLVYRVIHLIRTGVDPKSIVIITFTRKAGNELKYRISKILPDASLGFVGTFHAFANYISTLLGNASPISKFRLLDQEDDIQVHKLVMSEFREFNSKMRAKKLQKTISYCANTRMTVEEYVTKFDLHDLKEDIGNIEEYMELYKVYKTNHLLANYDDMISLVSRYLEKDNETKVAAPFEYLMIDEYQDTNKMQLDFVKNLNIPNVMAIGDDFQGIYSFRGADHRIILNFYHDFTDAKMVKLVENYRSNDDIISMVNQTIERSKLGYQKELHGNKKSEGKVQVISGESINQHKEFIIDRIKSLPEETHALIYRYNKNRTVFEKQLIEDRIEYSVYGGIRLLERKHVKDVLAFLMVYLNRRDIVSYNRILTLLPGVGAKTARRLIDTDMNDISKFGGEKGKLLLNIKNIITSDLEKEELLKEVCHFYFEIYQYVESENYSKDDIRDDFKLIQDLLATYDSLHNFIINLILDPVVDLHKGKNPKVVLTTIHSAKGLEFDNVYYFHTHDWYRNYDFESLEEDRRLFYVGISRAKNNLFVFDHSDVTRSFGDILRDFENAVSGYSTDQVKTVTTTASEEKGDYIQVNTLQEGPKSVTQKTAKPDAEDASLLSKLFGKLRKR